MMKEVNWKRKLTSRKLWTAVASFVSMMIVATGGAENTATPGNGTDYGRRIGGRIHHRGRLDGFGQHRCGNQRRRVNIRDCNGLGVTAWAFFAERSIA